MLTLRLVITGRAILLAGMKTIASTIAIGMAAAFIGCNNEREVLPRGPLDAYLEARAGETDFSGVVLVARGAKILIRRAYGHAHSGRPTPSNNYHSDPFLPRRTALPIVSARRVWRFTK